MTIFTKQGRCGDGGKWRSVNRGETEERKEGGARPSYSRILYAFLVKHHVSCRVNNKQQTCAE